jgi:hypothetical protein
MRSVTTQDTASWTNTSGFKLGISVKIPVPWLKDLTPTFEYSTEDAMTQSSQQTHAWSLAEMLFVSPHTNVDAEWDVWEDRFATDYTTVIKPRNMKIVIILEPPFFGEFSFPIELTVNDFLAPAEQIFQGTGTFTGMVGNRTVTNASQTAVWCGNPLVLGIESGLLSDNTQRAVKQIAEKMKVAEQISNRQP